MDNYFERPEVSNSDLSWLHEQLCTREERPDPTEAYKFGTLIDMMITEPEKVDYFTRACHDETKGVLEFTPEDFDLAREMKKAFFRDPLCAGLVKGAVFQKVMSIQNKAFTYGQASFTLSVRCKWDFFIPSIGWGGDIKSTTAANQKEFEAAVEFFDYDRQRAWYMDIAGSDQDLLIGISKKNFKVFKVPIRRGDTRYRKGHEKYSELAWRWFQYFGDMSSMEVKTDQAEHV